MFLKVINRAFLTGILLLRAVLYDTVAS